MMMTALVFFFFTWQINRKVPPFFSPLFFACLGHLASVYLSLPVLLVIKKVDRALPIPMDRREEGFLMFALFVFSLSLVFYVFSFLSIGPFPDRALVRDDGDELFPVSKKRPFPPKITPLTFMFTGTEMSGYYVVSAGFLSPEAFPKVLPW
jgi:hypothetical protein